MWVGGGGGRGGGSIVCLEKAKAVSNVVFLLPCTVLYFGSEVSREINTVLTTCAIKNSLQLF